MNILERFDTLRYAKIILSQNGDLNHLWLEGEDFFGHYTKKGMPTNAFTKKFDGTSVSYHYRIQSSSKFRYYDINGRLVLEQ